VRRTGDVTRGSAEIYGVAFLKKQRLVALISRREEPM
jgi:hypothetical protein